MSGNRSESPGNDALTPPGPAARLGLVALVALAVCGYALLWKSSIVDHYAREAIAVGDAASPGARVLQHLILLPLLIGAYFGATGAKASAGGTLRVLARQLGWLLTFVLLVRPALILALALAPSGAIRPPGLAALESDFPLDSWLSTMLDYSLLYALGLFLILGLIAFARYRHALVQAEALRSRRLQGQLETLRVRLQPHFLFNTLNTISARVGAEPEEARALISELAGLLRDSIDDGQSEFHPLGREMRLAEKYLRIVSARFAPRLACRSEIAPALAHWPIPYGLLLALLENAVTHGIAAVSGECALSVRCALEGPRLAIEVRNSYVADADGPSGPRGGLASLESRLTALYGAGFSLDSRGDGTGLWCARVLLPEAGASAMPTGASRLRIAP